ncbi:hypothetical protein LOK49_LG01G03465 [Camellia lanceoleosa]|uniref:Uncharacterized protein n=1 Tax=Camellia lanceoleosa TaxID=1840588 RepID=A0ACC0J1V8_9ERIC|nr:hypothetical protein LOK49_LG01G03465 [Camellia lanceoleosa]
MTRSKTKAAILMAMARKASTFSGYLRTYNKTASWWSHGGLWFGDLEMRVFDLRIWIGEGIGLRGVAKSREDETESARVSVKRDLEREMEGSRVRRNIGEEREGEIEEL